MRPLIIIYFYLPTLLISQSVEKAPLPIKFAGLELEITIDHFPSPVYASTDPDEPGTYFWKHNTAVLSPNQEITIEEGGAYLFYNNQWNLRITYNGKDFAKLFGIPEGRMKAGQPYTFMDNWRRDTRLMGGWAMWYVIGITADGDRVYGIGKLDTVGSLFPKS